jgi:hypothetical protein
LNIVLMLIVLLMFIWRQVRILHFEIVGIRISPQHFERGAMPTGLPYPIVIWPLAAAYSLTLAIVALGHWMSLRFSIAYLHYQARRCVRDAACRHPGKQAESA